MNKLEIFEAILRERARQDQLHPYDPDNVSNYDMLAVLMEEVGEVAQCLQGELTEETAHDLVTELIQVAAVCVKWLEE